MQPGDSVIRDGGADFRQFPESPFAASEQTRRDGIASSRIPDYCLSWNVCIQNVEKADVAEILSAETPSNGSEVLETREWIDSLDYVLSAGRSGAGGPAAATVVTACPARRRRQSAFHGNYTLCKYHSYPSTALFSGQPGHGAPHQESGPLECHGHGGSRQQDAGRHRRAYLDFCVRCHFVRGGLQSFSACQHRGRRPRHCVFSGTCRSGYVFPCLPRRTHSQREAGKFSARIETRGRTQFLSASLADA